MSLIEKLQELVLPQHRLKKKINNYIKHKNKNGLRKYYYTFLRDLYSVRYGIEIGVDTVFDGYVDFPHPRNILIGEGAKIGKNFCVYNNVTIGQKNGKYPIIGDNVTVYSGTIIIGEIHIGNNVIIGANSLVNKDIEDDVIVAGNPAKIIRKRSRI